MRCVLLHLKQTTPTEVAAALDEVCSGRYGSGLRWVYPSSQQAVLYVNLYADYERYEPEVWAAVRSKLGDVPDVSIIAEVAGRTGGRRAVIGFTRQILAQFEGVAQDDYTAYLWTKEEIETDQTSQGHRFFDTIGWWESNSTKPPN
jgi:hypothetical protein